MHGQGLYYAFITSLLTTALQYDYTQVKYTYNAYQ